MMNRLIILTWGPNVCNWREKKKYEENKDKVKIYDTNKEKEEIKSKENGMAETI